MLELLVTLILIVGIVLLLSPFILAGMGLGVMKHFSREMNNAKNEKKTRKNNFWRTSKSAKQQKPEKVFAADEGTYVDFEEVEDKN